MTRTSARVLDGLSRDRLDAVIEQVRREQAVRVHALELGKLERGVEAELLSALGRAGLEHTGQVIRVPLRLQLRELVARAGELGATTTALAREVKGARSLAEVRFAIGALVAEGELALVTDASEQSTADASEPKPGSGRVPRLLPRTAQVLADGELDLLAELARHLLALATATKPAQAKPRPSLLRSALAPALATLRELCSSGDGPARQRETAESGPEPANRTHGAARELAAAVHAAFLVAPAPSGFVRVPDVIRTLERVHAREALLAATDALAREGVLELRPDASITRMSDDDRARCPRALDGTPLSYARLISHAQGARA